VTVQEPAERLAAERAETVRQLTALERELHGIIESAGAAGTDDEHDPEGPTVAFERQHVAALLARAKDRLAEIDAARQRLADGGYGYCEACGQLIGADRLAARPAAARCVTCAGRR
jgi:DnaK suppressor protein